MQAYSLTLARHETPWGVTLYEYGAGKKHYEYKPEPRAPKPRRRRVFGEVLWDRKNCQVNGIAIVPEWTGGHPITTNRNHWELQRVVVGRASRLMCEGICKGPHCKGSFRAFDASDWTGKRQLRESHWCTTCRNENGGPRNKRNHTPMLPAMPMVKEKGWGIGTLLVADRWRAPRKICNMLDNTIRLTDGRSYVWAKRLPIDVREYEQSN